MVYIVKIYFVNSNKDTEIRRIAVTTDTVSEFKFLQQKIQNLFQLPNADNLDIKWKDSENDLILMSSNDELAQALANADDLLRLYISIRDEQGENFPKEANNNEEIQHPMVVCDNCEKDISGCRYKCLECWDYDLCSSCNAANAHPKHDMIKLTRPTYIARKWLFQGSDRMWKSMFRRCINRFLKGHFEGIDGSAKVESSTANPEMNQKAEPEGSASSSSSKTSSPTTEPKIPHSSEKPDHVKDFKELYETYKEFFPEYPYWENAVPKTLPSGTRDFIQENIKGFCKFVDGVVGGLSNCEQKESGTNPAPPTSTTSTPQTSDASVTPDAAASSQATKVTDAQVQASTEPVESSSMEIGTNQTPIEVEDEQNIDEIVIDPENGTTQVHEGLSSTGEGWTLLEGDFTSSRMDCAPSSCGEAVSRPTEPVAYPNVMDVEADQATRPEINSGDYIQSRDPRIRSAVITMQGMGFSNEGGWLERLLISKNANINETLEALYPSMR